MVDVTAALDRLLAAAAPLPAVDVPLQDAAGRVLAEAVSTDRDYPPADRSAMDGFAVRASDCVEPERSLTVVGEVRAGERTDAIAIGAGEAVRIYTGGLIPRGADAVVMVERTAVDPSTGSVRILEPPEPGQHVRRRGEDARAGAIAVSAGAVLRPEEIAALASVGRTGVRAIRAPVVAVASTGDEIVAGHAAPGPHQVRDSNARMLLAAVDAAGAVGRDLGVAKDDPASLDALLAEGLRADVLLVSGGVSVGAYDLVRAAVERAGCEVLFHGVSMRPGKPILAARRGAGLVFGLPGNPLSAHVGFHVFVLPAIRKLGGHPRPVAPLLRARLLERLPRRTGRTSYAIARLSWESGTPSVAPVANASSGDVLSLARANAFIVAEGDDRPLEAGVAVQVLPWSPEPS
ncbi:MAG TPA: gephyrin-like molybdotransferase Glp [Candidatus Polarisedimenticolaceae bacterium]|nr:gephyrin-like molybdotransferase Glp [Candidatus Polarisedimenticolaceae bacterium]